MKQGVDYTGVCVVYFCHDGKGKFVMAKRNSNTTDEHNKWDIGGGKVEFDDDVEDRLKKEVKQEYCTDVLEFEFLGYRDVHRMHDGKRTHWVALDFKVLVDPSKVRNGEPHKFDEVGWFTFDNLPDNLHSTVPVIFEKYSGKLR